MGYLNKNFWYTLIGFLVVLVVAISGLYLATIYFPDASDQTNANIAVPVDN
ncbi:MAG: hypothetical protein NTV48_01390 [Candidatus Vogelbacteria bacterium]|nr:hypothetical protein [Candidatus Vogelbacteria bacterium]